jgi:hypothetical protein
MFIGQGHGRDIRIAARLYILQPGCGGIGMPGRNTQH